MCVRVHKCRVWREGVDVWWWGGLLDRQRIAQERLQTTCTQRVGSGPASRLRQPGASLGSAAPPLQGRPRYWRQRRPLRPADPRAPSRRHPATQCVRVRARTCVVWVASCHARRRGCRQFERVAGGGDTQPASPVRAAAIDAAAAGCRQHTRDHSMHSTHADNSSGYTISHSAAHTHTHIHAHLELKWQ